MGNFRSKYRNPMKTFEPHGVKEAGGYTYILLINLQGQVVIKRIKDDKSEILFYQRPTGTSIADFWSDPTAWDSNYTYLFRL